MVAVITNPFVLIFLSVVFGLALGKIRVGRFSLGSSGALFAGLVIGWFVFRRWAVPWLDNPAAPGYALRLIKDAVVTKDLFLFSLSLFIASVGLLASRYLGKVVEVYGIKLILMGFLVPVIGAAVSWGLSRVIPGVPPLAVPGVFTGALTSSPGLAAAVEQAAPLGAAAESDVGFGYAVGYIPGVLTVVLGMQLLPLLFKLDAEKENQAFCEDLDIDPEEERDESGGFRPLEFFLVCAVGYLIGAIKIPLGGWGSIGLGATGGTLVAGLVLGFVGKIGPLRFRMSPASLGAVREIGIVMFLAIVGLRYGYRTVSSLSEGGLALLAVAFGAAVLSLAIGFLLGRYVFKLNWIMLAGSLCGAMTSTPGLGAAVDSTGCDDVATGYGAVYPFALLSMVILTILLTRGGF